MRGSQDPQSAMFSYISPEERVPKRHPLRRIKVDADAVLNGLSPTFDAMYRATGRPSIPPERLLKSLLLIALYSVRSDRLFCEMLDYHILFRWFLDMNLEEASFDASTFSKNRERLLEHDVAHKFFHAVVEHARQQRLLSDEHFTVDSTLIEAWASLKSFKPKDGDDAPPPNDSGNASVDFRGQKRSNETHQSTTDPESRLLRKGLGKEAKLCFAGHALMDNRHGLCTDLLVTASVGITEPEAATQMLDRQQIQTGTLGADKGYYTRDFVAGLRERGIKPHIAIKADHRINGLDQRTTRHASYAISQRKRKQIEEIFGWAKSIGGLRKTRFRGVARTQQFAHVVAAAYNLLRIARLQPG
jgi:transposase